MPESESVETVDLKQESKLENIPRKRIRHRKRQLYDNIIKQMEFYFSDANLSKDRYLNELVNKDPYVPISEFLKFNKINSMTQEITDIAKALSHSTFLELSEDKLKVKRKTPLLPYDVDARTVYVESIPVKATQDWLKKVFSNYGHVAYISLPKFRNTQRIKGFGFIEFEKPQEAQKCINAFIKMGCKLPTCMPPEELSSIKMFSVDEPPNDANESKEEYEPPKKKNKKSKDKKKNLELKIENDSDSERRVETPSEETKSLATPPEDENKSLATPTEDENKSLATPTEEGKTTDAESKDEMTSQDESKNDGSPRRKKKIKKRKTKNGTKDKNKLNNTEVQNGLWGLQVLPKCEWKALRNKYLNLQRKYMKEARAMYHSKKNVYTAIPASAAPTLEGESAIKAQEIESSKTVAPLERIPGVFVEEMLPEPCLDVRLVKRTIKSNIHAQHVEAKEGLSEVIIRFDSAKAADEYCTNSNNRARVLCGAEEQEQWVRAEETRAAGKRGRRGRGREPAGPAPALAPASPQPTHTHIRFDE
ncbi:La-related protein 7 [Papilio machaon]|uniref:La-related protein 7 n=1 Tax=Papilio machaon TaxID=76193 RepID=A0A0N1IFW3_PAPMA|nr:La-related protein 7 [Papilio machaon]